MSPRRIAIAALTAASVLLGLAGFGFAQSVGVTGAVNPNTTGTPPGGTVRALGTGNDVVFNERITTEAKGQADILFVDRSALTVGPNSDLVIDEFVYSPETGTGKLAASATKGVFRFVGGALSKNPDAVTIKTPSAIVGVRGGVILLAINSTGGAAVYFIYGEEANITTDIGHRSLHRRSWGIDIGSDGTIGSPHPADPAVLLGLLKLLNGQTGGNGGASPPPTEQTLAGGPSLFIDDDIDANQIDLRAYLRPVDQFDIYQIEKLYKTRQPKHGVIIICTDCCTRNCG
jgi:trimeric autotransporter adhesin